jgi:predicted RND superfamily exporter protein
MIIFFAVVGICFCFCVSMMLVLLTIYLIQDRLHRKPRKIKIQLDEWEEILSNVLESKN